MIGPAAENLVRFSAIENDYWRSVGRNGVGTAMGYTRLMAWASQITDVVRHLSPIWTEGIALLRSIQDGRRRSNEETDQAT